MSNFHVKTRYGNQLWIADHNSKPYIYKWGNNKFWINILGIFFSTEIEIEVPIQEALIRCLVSGERTDTPSWDMVPADLHRTIENIFDKVRAVAVEVDKHLRQTPKGIRLAPLTFEGEFVNQTHVFPVVYWSFSDEERERLTSLYSHRDLNFRSKFKNGFNIPLPSYFSRKQILLETREMEQIGENLSQGRDYGPSSSLYSIAWDNFIARSFDSAILILATSIETALKHWLSIHGDRIAKYFIHEIQSPPLEKLFLCANAELAMDLPGIFSEWLVRLRKTRNDIAHKPSLIKINSLEIARWFAVGEAILKSLYSYKSDPLVGFLVEPVGDKAIKRFPPNCRGIVLRREEAHGEDCLHVLMDTGVTWRFSDMSCRKCRIQSF